MKLRVLSLIEEISPENEALTDDVDIKAKINYVIDMKSNELARIKKIAVSETLKVKENQEINLYEDLDDFYQLGAIKGIDYEMFENIVTFKETGTAKINYYKYPKRITADTDDKKYKFEHSADVLEIMPLGIAADLLKSDVSSQYGRIYEDAYQNALRMLDMKVSSSTMKIKGGIYV